MQVEEAKEGGVLILSPSGRLEARSAPEFEKQVVERIAAGETKLLLDLAGVEYLSSAGLRALLVAAKRIREKNGKIAVCSLSPGVEEVFKVSGFDSILPMQPPQ